MKAILFSLLLSVGLLAQEAIFKDKIYDADGGRHDLNKSEQLAILGITGTYFTGDSIFYSRTLDLGGRHNSATGNFGVAIKIDSVAADSTGGNISGANDPDTLYFWPQYWAGPTTGWVTGDTMAFHVRYDTLISGGWPTTYKEFIDRTAHGTVYFWQSSPADSFSIHSYPLQKFRLKGKVRSDSDGRVHLGADFSWDAYHEEANPNN